jgi:hypothetical protein
MKAKWRVPRTTHRQYFDRLWLSIGLSRDQRFVGVGLWLLCVGSQTQLSESRLRSGMKHLGAGLGRRLVAPGALPYAPLMLQETIPIRS